MFGRGRAACPAQPSLVPSGARRLLEELHLLIENVVLRASQRWGLRGQNPGPADPEGPGSGSRPALHSSRGMVGFTLPVLDGSCVFWKRRICNGVGQSGGRGWLRRWFQILQEGKRSEGVGRLEGGVAPGLFPALTTEAGDRSVGGVFRVLSMYFLFLTIVLTFPSVLFPLL